MRQNVVLCGNGLSNRVCYWKWRIPHIASPIELSLLEDSCAYMVRKCTSLAGRSDVIGTDSPLTYTKLDNTLTNPKRKKRETYRSVIIPIRQYIAMKEVCN